ncbi:biotin-dependent carboxyltransferase family protein [Halalkalibacter urbisdiaboli]|uniref:5-oxoprolinase subunit C family protein n=1 Tax=Halalkalibacter urbisdiaboli TaxID=1960589 RepID=UPI000B432BCA|nr:biotin-dependent carboxyltransferase family protein [Halalkalibacter urbisdiaboli]
MGEAFFQVLKPGLLTSVQDAGRYGYQQSGIVASGAMDPFAYEVSNRLVGNQGDAAVLEVTLAGPTLLALADRVISICGADLSATIDGHRAPLWSSFRIKMGQQLSFGKPMMGMRAYIAVQGGFDVEPVLGSRSTYVKGQLGGLGGRALEKGDLLQAGTVPSRESRGRSLHPDAIPRYDEDKPIRVILGPDLESFTKAGIATFLSISYTLSNELDRMGCRLIGVPIEHSSKADILSDAVTFGTIQVPANGQPMILLADRQTTGGYARIAHVIDVDLPRLGQLKPGQSVSFQEVDVETAQRMLRNQASWLMLL